MPWPIESNELPPGWTSRRLADACRIRSGGTPPKSDPSLWTGSLPWVSGKDLKVHRLKDSIDHITDAAGRDYSEIAPKDSVLVLVRGMGLVNSFAASVVERPMAFNQDLKALIPNNDTLTGAFLVYALSFAGPRMLQNVSDAAHGTKRISQEDLERFELHIPPMSDQARIVDVLDTCSTAVEVERTALSKTKSLKQSVMRELFTGGLRGEAQKESEIGPVPESWNVVSFASVRSRLQYGTSVRCSTDVQRFPVLRIPNVESGRVNTTQLKYCDLAQEEAATYRLKNGDLLFIRTNGVLDRLGICAVYQAEPKDALFASYLIRAQLKDVVEPKFAAAFFASEQGVELIAARATPAADGKYNLNTGIIDSLPLPLPPTVKEQRESVEILDAIDQRIAIHIKKRAVLQDLFKALLQKLMTGEIRVSDLNLAALDEIPAQVSA